MTPRALRWIGVAFPMAFLASAVLEAGFATAVNYTVGSAPKSLAVGDFNRDGKQDLAVVNSDSNNVSVLLGNGDGTFQMAANYGVGLGPRSAVVGDFNGDGKQDLAVANSNSGNVSILLGNGDGTFQSPLTHTAGFGPYSLVIGDFNGDGKQDLAVANLCTGCTGNVSILLGDGSGAFLAARSYDTGLYAVCVVVGDFDGDGKQDLAVGNTGSMNVSILLGRGDGTFKGAVNYAAGTQAAAIAVGDFNGDGKQDLAVADSGSSDVAILVGNGNGTFLATVRYGVGTTPFSIVPGDFNADGKLDLAVANGNSANVSILLGNGDGTFNAAVNFAVGTGPASIAVGDFDRDGKQDLTVANSGSDNVSVLLNDDATGYFTLAPCRIIDTTSPPGPSGGPALAAGSTRTFPAAGLCGIPATAKAIAVIVTTAQQTDFGDLRVYAAGDALPAASTINFAVNHPRANNAIVSLGTAGQIAVTCDMPPGSTGTTRLIVDVYGYFE